MQSRRRALKSVGSLVGIGLVGTVSGRGSENGASLAELGLEQEIENLFKNGEVEKAHKILDANNVRYFSGSSSLDTPTIQEVQWSKSDSEQNTTLVHRQDDVWIATNHTQLKGADQWNARDARNVDDAIGMDWDNDRWTAIGRTEDDVLFYIYGELPDDGDIDIEYEDYTYYGVAGRIEYDNDSFTSVKDTDFGVSMQTDLIRDTDDDRIGIKGSYAHTFSFLPRGVSISVGRSGFHVSVPTGADKWKLESNAYP